MILRTRRLLGSDAVSAPTVSELFHENTKLHRGVLPEFAGNDYGDAETGAMVSAGRRYARAARVPLAGRGDEAARVSVRAAMDRRRSQRSFSTATPLAFERLSELLSLTNGVTGEVRLSGGRLRHLRASPSAGALYPIEIYVAVRSVAGLDAGLYHFAPREAELELLHAGDPTGALLGACYYHDSLRQASAVVVLSGVLERTKRKYGERGYRYVLIEAGHVAQNLCLAAAALDVACMPVCGFFDDELNDLLALDGIEETALYVAYLGPAAETEAGRSAP